MTTRGYPVALAVVEVGHADLGDDTYHQWVVIAREGRVARDALGRRNPRMDSREWIVVVCNNAVCGGYALVHEDALISLVERAELNDDRKAWST